MTNRYTWSQYSSAILWAQTLHRSRGRAGFETSAHLMSILLMRTMFSGVENVIIFGDSGTVSSDDSLWFSLGPSSMLTDLVNTCMNFDKCSKCLVISVAKTISMIDWRTSRYVSRSKFLKMLTGSEFEPIVNWKACAAWWLSNTELTKQLLNKTSITSD